MSDDNLILQELMAKVTKSNFTWVSSQEILHHPEDLLLHFAGKASTDPSSGSAQLVWETATRDLARMAGDPHYPSYYSDVRSRLLAAQMEHSATTPLPLRVPVDPATTILGRRNISEEDTVTASATVVPSGAEAEAAVRLPVRVIAMPPGYLMARIARSVFFFSPRTVERVFEEIIADYRHEMVKGEASGKSTRELHAMRIQHWGGFIIAVVLEIAEGTVGRIWKALKGG